MLKPFAAEIRDAVPEDLPAILRITNDAISATTANWAWAPVPLAAREAWFEERRARGFPVIVAVADGAVVGFGSYGEFRHADGYCHTVEHSVYVDGHVRRQGIGAALLDRLIDAARRDGKHVILGGIEAGNEPSLALHRRAGFVETGRLPQVGRKFDRWLDLVFMQKLLGN